MRTVSVLFNEVIKVFINSIIGSQKYLKTNQLLNKPNLCYLSREKSFSLIINTDNKVSGLFLLIVR